MGQRRLCGAHGVIGRHLVNHLAELGDWEVVGLSRRGGEAKGRVRYKVYGAHLGPFKTPARETDAPHMPPEFNVDQQTFLEIRQQDKTWAWSAIRPSVVCGLRSATR